MSKRRRKQGGGLKRCRECMEPFSKPHRDGCSQVGPKVGTPGKAVRQ